jgi:hypothetical protein
MAETTKTRKSRDYSKGMIYIIRSVNPTTGQVYTYIGSTTSFDNRKTGHKSRIYTQNQKAYNSKLYKTIRENNGDWTMSKFKLFPCNSKIELEIEEERCRQGINANLNSNTCSTGIDRSSMTPQEYKKIYDEQYYQQNREQKREYNEQYYQQNREQKREYYEKNCEQIKAKQRERYSKNKSKE